MVATYQLRTDGNRAIDITDEVAGAVADSGVREGIAVVALPHTTASLGIISFPDPLGLIDVMDEVNRLIPTRIDFKHQHDTPQDAAGHIKSTLFGTSLSLIVTDGALLLGHSQKVYFMEHDGPRNRQFHVQIVGR
ncbi:secondary thiamine-phosphate synthase enzyme YjbQ [Streptomyces sp. RTd22]|uniref:secondary thiamine-phosphate synthase enzyme YjbQ n=1 Tax=Streptomyces sp. RTd22 TaxID=1841249 RepID=UPI0007C47AB9|nr:secondary thiamine-phosphate synthase enzyme YjbQ [Streptomyces sp. RTd22]